MSRPVIDNIRARRLFLAAQGLSRSPRLKLTDSGLLDLIERLGYVQVDSINTVERAHHLIVFSRNQTYRRDRLAHLLEHEASLFENWTHDASIIPTRLYPFWMRRFDRERDILRRRWRRHRRAGFEEMLGEVLDHVRASGAVMARNLGDGRKTATDGWWDWHPSKTALEFLWRTGDLAVARREGFQKVYDLAERVIPAPYRKETPSTDEFIDWACRGALQRLGFATPGELASFWGGLTPAETELWCRKNLNGDVIEVLIEPANGTRPKAAYARPDLLDPVGDSPASPGQIRILSPFDPVLRNRDRTERLFNFRYRIEVFLPEAKRRYGYYVFPLLERDRLIGRIDMKHRRQGGGLHVIGLWLESGIRFTRARQDRLAAELDRVGKFIRAEAVVFENGFLKSGY